MDTEDDEELESREKTLAEIRADFLDTLRMDVHHWYTLHPSRNETGKPDALWRLEGLAFTILSLIDGCAGDMPGFALVPTAHPDDEAYHKAQGDDYYPYFEPEGDIREDRMLHEDWYAEEREKRNRERANEIQRSEATLGVVKKIEEEGS